MSAIASAQESFINLSEAAIPQALRGGKQHGAAGWGGFAELRVRYSWIGGDDGAGGDWSDDFSNGYGYRAVTSLAYTFDQVWTLGGFFSVGQDFFKGKGSLDNMDVWAVQVGPKLRADVAANWFAEASLGFGFVSYSQVEASGITLFESSAGFAWELTGRVGYEFFVERGGQFLTSSPRGIVTIGIGAGSWEEPDVAIPGLSAEPIENFFVELAIGISF